MADVSHAVSIPSPPAVVFPWMLDVDKVPRWVEGVEAYEVVGGGEPAAGRQLRQRLTVAGMTLDVVGDVLAYEPPHRALTVSESHGIALHIEYAVAAEGDGSRVTQAVAVKTSGLKARMIAPMVRQQMDAKIASDLARLRELLAARI